MTHLDDLLHPFKSHIVAGPLDGLKRSRDVLTDVTAELHLPVRSRVANVFARWDQIAGELNGIANTLARTLDSPSLNDQARREQSLATLTQIRGRVDTALADAQRQADEVRELLRKAVRPARPQPADAAQEGALANLRADLTMLLNASDEPWYRLTTMLQDALADGDRLTAWLIASTPWPARYLESRNISAERIESFHVRVPDILVERSGDDSVRHAARALRSLEGRDGLPGVLVSAGWLVRHIFDLYDRRIRSATRYLSQAR